MTKLTCVRLQDMELFSKLLYYATLSAYEFNDLTCNSI